MNKIKDVLDLKGLRQVWLAKRLGKSDNMVNGYMQSQQQPGLEVLTR
jgi:putative transcriptional regulator